MMRTYKALLSDDRLEWIDEPPSSKKPLSVQVTVLDAEQESSTKAGERGLAMARLLERLAERGTFADIEDPVAWQQELRQDRESPRRNGL